MPASNPAPPRRRMTPERVGELYDAVIEVLAEVGYEALTIDAVAARARTSKATLYRQWNGKTELVASALRHIGPVPGAEFDTGSLRGDLIALATRGARDERDTSVFRAMNEAASREPLLHEVLRELIFDPTMHAFSAAVERAVERGELAADSPAIEFTGHMVMGAITAYAVVENRQPETDFIVRYIDAAVLPALGVR
ncbi:TetR/AcrR family transcriptional regulator [Nocardia sp. NPDC056100]|uniref:TetR/AcrR family transcriptional regulator n=1 Tax=Nocardia sp. NPDC056100 TaxID=3345712 RepID=UPI0035E2A4C1